MPHMLWQLEWNPSHFD